MKVSDYKAKFLFKQGIKHIFVSLFTSDIYRLDKINDSINDLATGKVNRALIEFL